MIGPDLLVDLAGGILLMTVDFEASAWMSGLLFAVEELPSQPGLPPDLTGLYWMIMAGWIISVITTVCWIWMLWHCYRNEPDREFWFWVMLFMPPAAAVYFFVRFLPGGNSKLPRGLKRWTRGREIEQLEIAARQIGNPHHWIQLGDALREVGQYSEAAEAYDKALAKEAENIQALWGAGIANLEHGQFAAAREHLEKGLSIKADYKFGDMSLAYGRTLAELGELDRSAEHLAKHVHRWRHPEALYLLATLELERENPEQARHHLEGMLLDINGSPKAIARKHTRWKSRAVKLLRQLPR
jgi:hypothetical protein